MVKNQNRLHLSSWLCLPLNQHYEVQGSWQLSDTYQSLRVVASCHASCGINNCGYINVYYTNAKVNPDLSQPFEYYLERYQLQLSDVVWNYYINYIDSKTVHTDESLFPFQNKKTQQSSVSSATRQQVASIKYSYGGYTDLWLERSAVTYTFNRRYLTFIDVLSYVGGIFPSIIGVFFFMRLFGIYFYETTFAYEHFHDSSVKYNHFGAYLKKVIYGTLKFFGFQLNNWNIC
jgi:hypothetical protein